MLLDLGIYISLVLHFSIFYFIWTWIFSILCIIWDSKLPLRVIPDQKSDVDGQIPLQHLLLSSLLSPNHSFYLIVPPHTLWFLFPPLSLSHTLLLCFQPLPVSPAPTCARHYLHFLLLFLLRDLAYPPLYRSSLLFSLLILIPPITTFLFLIHVPTSLPDFTQYHMVIW